MTKQRTCMQCPHCNDKIPFLLSNKKRTGDCKEYLCEKLNKYKLNKELPPPSDCPLKDTESHINIQTTTAYNSGYKYGYEKAKQDMDKQLLDQYSKGWDDGAKDAMKDAIAPIEKVCLECPEDDNFIKLKKETLIHFSNIEHAIRETIKRVRRETND